MSEKTLRVPLYGTPGKWISPEAAQTLFRRLGLEPEVPVMIYTGKGLFKGWGDGLEQTMVAYSLVRFGHNNVYVLDGSLDKWLKEERPTSQVFLFKHFLGYPKVKLYEGSFTERSSYPDNPIVIGENPR